MEENKTSPAFALGMILSMGLILGSGILGCVWLVAYTITRAVRFAMGW